MSNQLEAKERKIPQPKGRILYVDDELSMRRFIPFPLMAEGYEVTTVSEGNEVLKLLQESPNKYDLILSDIGLEDMDGVEMGKQIRKNPQTANIPIIYLSGNLSEEKLGEIKQLGGVTSALEKPVLNKELIAAIDQTLNRVRKPRT